MKKTINQVVQALQPARQWISARVTGRDVWVVASAVSMALLPHLALADTFQGMQTNAISQANQVLNWTTGLAIPVGGATYGIASFIHSLQVEEQDSHKWRIWKKRIIYGTGGVFLGSAILDVVSAIVK